MFRRTIMFSIATIALTSVGVGAQTPAPAPPSTVETKTLEQPVAAPSDVSKALTTDQQNQLTIGLQQLTILDLQAKALAAEYEKARAALQAYVASITPAGYVINLQKMALEPVPPAKEPEKK